MGREQLLWMLLFVLAAGDGRCDDLGTEESFVVPTGLELKVSRGQILSAQFECYLKIITDPPNAENGPYCNRTWDGWLCWGDSPPGTAMQFCPEYFQDFDPTEKVTKVCNPNGQWFRHPESDRIWSNYTQCSAYIHEKLKFAFSLYYLAIVGHGLSVVSLLISLGIFSCFKSLSCQRISLHKNMFLSFILNSICTVIWLSAVANNQQLVERNPIGCKVLSVLNLYICGTNYFWMLCEGIYLHTLIIVAVFVGEQQLGWYYVLGWGFPIIPAVTHAVARWLFYNDNCWISSDTHLVYIIHGPIHAALLVNLFFLLNIVRVLITKLKVTHSAESNAYMKAVRATLILVPLLGVQFVLVPWRPKGRVALVVYDFIMHIFMHFQGFLVAVIFCFCNGEVQAVLKRHWRRHKVQCRGRLMGVDWHSSYHTNSSITEMSRASISLKPTGPETQVNGLSNGSHSSSGDREGPGGGLETSVI
ncbi:calcitonin gene-related peptide type 1 receptor-like [Paramormyrops kingsleyae]|uniref:Calcitonin gene-related peptide type 1 receptor n=1 Tax=Paramormyrops kingsleyae TaxID=1676925 RepID=A0A3B3T360_9TELE|nr:calcitonin gene-related peptide type 1 receptor-like [Paramormyrops kingsleyae]XP_023660879.1 calcitonin gene-related peptide type 1 receptor-like [Paramormyrops kingsleyae]